MAPAASQWQDRPSCWVRRISYLHRASCCWPLADVEQSNVRVLVRGCYGLCTTERVVHSDLHVALSAAQVHVAERHIGQRDSGDSVRHGDVAVERRAGGWQLDAPVATGRYDGCCHILSIEIHCDVVAWLAVAPHHRLLVPLQYHARREVVVEPQHTRPVGRTSASNERHCDDRRQSRQAVLVVQHALRPRLSLQTDCDRGTIGQAVGYGERGCKSESLLINADGRPIDGDITSAGIVEGDKQHACTALAARVTVGRWQYIQAPR